MEARATRYTSYAEYLEAEEHSEVRHEWIDGQVYALHGELAAMAGGTEEHAFITLAVAGELRTGLRGRPCRALSADMRIRSLVSGEAHYADIAVVCGPRIAHPEDRNTATNPTVLVEVLSPSTEAYDRGAKFEDYQTLGSLCDYVLVSTGRNHVDHYARHADGSWIRRSYGPGGALVLTGCDVTLLVDAIYEGVEAVRELANVVSPPETPPRGGG